MSSREILTLQFGHYANYIGAHWWNTQESGFNYNAESSTPSELNHDVLYREGLTPKGEVTFTPRCLLVDLKGSLRTLNQQGDLYNQGGDVNPDTIFWDKNSVEVKEEEKPSKNEFQEALEGKNQLNDIKHLKLEDKIATWTDFLYTRFHPRTVNIVNEYNHNSVENENGFDVFNLGKDIWKGDFGEDFGDKIRNYMEECDSLQGFQIILDSYNGFGGLSASCIEHLKDEYDKKTILTIPVIPGYHNDYNFTEPKDREKSIKMDAIRTINNILAFDFLSCESCLTIPICTGTLGWRQPGPKRILKNLNYQNELNYHSSALISSYLETVTLPYRIKSSNYTLNDFCSYQNSMGRKISAASLNLPLGLNQNQDLIDFLDKYEGILYQSLTPNCKIETDKNLQQISLRGVPINRLKRPVDKAKNQRGMPAYRCETVKHMLEYYLQCTCIYSVNRVTAINAPMKVSTPFPKIFNDNFDVHGNVSAGARKQSESVESVPLLAGVHTGSYIGEMLDSLHNESKRYKISKIHQFKVSGLEDDEFKECNYRLLDLRDCYEETNF